MRILVIHEVSYLKKVVYEYQDFAERLASRGHDVTVIDFDDAGDGEGKSHQISKTGLAPIHLQETPFLAWPIIKFLSGRLGFRRELKRRLAAQEVDVIFLYSVFINGTQTIDLARRYGVPVVYRVLDVYHKVRQNRLIQLPLYLGEKKIYRQAPYIALTNEKMRAYVEKMAAPKPPGQIHVIHHGVDTEYFIPGPKSSARLAELGLSAGAKIMLFLGTLYPFSGLDRLIKQMGEQRARYSDLHLVIVGGGEQAPLLRSLIQQHGLEKSVFLTGSRPYAEVPEWLSIADVTLTPFEINDITRDIIPIKILQYLAAGKPSVCSPIPDVVRLMPEVRSGIRFCPIEENEGANFLETLAELARDPELNQARALQARQFVLSDFSMEHTMRSLESLFRDAVSIAHKTSPERKPHAATP